MMMMIYIQDADKPNQGHIHSEACSHRVSPQGGLPTIRVAVLNGPNLNLLGTREPQYYGTWTLEDIHNDLMLTAEKFAPLPVEIHFVQTNHEGAIIDAIHAEAARGTQAILINPGAYTHTSIALRDALSSFHGLKIEVHLSNIFQREEFRHKSYISPVVHSTLSGFGPLGYRMALTYVLQTLEATIVAS